MARVYLDSCVVTYLTKARAALLGGCTEFWINDHRLNAATKEKIDLRIFSG